jgi:hypothetical protein
MLDDCNQPISTFRLSPQASQVFVPQFDIPFSVPFMLTARNPTHDVPQGSRAARGNAFRFAEPVPVKRLGRSVEAGHDEIADWLIAFCCRCFVPHIPDRRTEHDRHDYRTPYGHNRSRRDRRESDRSESWHRREACSHQR